MNRFRPIPSPMALVAAILACAPISPLFADDVHLTNGRVFEDVVAHRSGDQVTIEMSCGGEITLAAARIERIERARATFEDYRERERTLRLQRDATAQDWLDLAYWAEENEFPNGYRESLLRASRFDANLPGLAPLLRELGLVQDPKTSEWISQDTFNRRQGLVQYDGRWVSAEERYRQVRQAEERAVDARRERILKRLTEIEIERQIVETARRQRPAPPTTVAVVAAPAFPVFVAPGYYYSPPGPTPPPSTAPPAAETPTTGERNYGRSISSTAIIPGRLNPGVSSPPGSLGSGIR
ncbi:MAG: hypothetical protein AAF604_20245 [Acidobacteriota bacterium]